jgi:hypothetical protein
MGDVTDGRNEAMLLAPFLKTQYVLAEPVFNAWSCRFQRKTPIRSATMGISVVIRIIASNRAEVFAGA